MLQHWLKEGNNNDEQQNGEDGESIVPVAREDQNAQLQL